MLCHPRRKFINKFFGMTNSWNRQFCVSPALVFFVLIRIVWSGQLLFAINRTSQSIDKLCQFLMTRTIEMDSISSLFLFVVRSYADAADPLSSAVRRLCNNHTQKSWSRDNVWKFSLFIGVTCPMCFFFFLDVFFFFLFSTVFNQMATQLNTAPLSKIQCIIKLLIFVSSRIHCDQSIKWFLIVRAKEIPTCLFIQIFFFFFRAYGVYINETL